MWPTSSTARAWFEHCLYQLVRQKAGGGERLFEIEFLDPGVSVYAFTFG